MPQLREEEYKRGSAHSAPIVSKIVRDWRQNLTDKKLPGLLNELHGAIGRFESGAFVSLYILLAAIAAVAQQLQADPKAWAKFCHHEFWDDIPKKAKPRKAKSDTLPYVMRFSMGSGNAARKNANRYVQAIRPLLEAGVTPEDLVEEIQKAGGIMKLVADTRAKGRKSGNSAIHDVEGNDGTSGPADKPKLRSESSAEINKPESTIEPVAEPKKEDDVGDNNDDDLGLAIDHHLGQTAASLMIEVLLERAVRENWYSTDPFPRKVHLVLDFVEADGGAIVAELVDWRDDKPWPGAHEAED